MGATGYFRWAKQTAKGTGNTFAGQTIYCINTDVTVQDLTRQRRPHIGGTALPGEGYKAGTAVGGAFTVEVPGKHIGYLIYFLLGKVAVTADTGPVSGVQVGVDTYTFTMDTDEFSIPYFTFEENKDDVIYTKGVDGRMLAGQFVFGAGDAVMATFAVSGITPSFGESKTPTEDSSPILVASTTNALVEVEDVATDASQCIVDVGNIAASLAEEMKIGSPYRRDVTVNARAVGVTMRRWADATAWKALYFGGGTTWGASPYSAKVEVRAASGNIIAGTEPYSLEFEAAEVMFVGARAPVQAQRITLMEMPGAVQVASGDDFSFVLGSVADVDFTLVPAA